MRSLGRHCLLLQVILFVKWIKTPAKERQFVLYTYKSACEEWLIPLSVFTQVESLRANKTAIFDVRVCVYTCIYALCVCVHMHVFSVYVYACMCVHMRMWCVCVCVCTHACMLGFVCVCVCVLHNFFKKRRCNFERWQNLLDGILYWFLHFFICAADRSRQTGHKGLSILKLLCECNYYISLQNSANIENNDFTADLSSNLEIK